MRKDEFAWIDDNIKQGPIPIPRMPDRTRALFSLVRVAPNPRVNFHVQFPIEDGVSPGLWWLDLAVAQLSALDAAGVPTYVHCQRGVSRSALLCAAFLMKKYALTAEAALAWVADRNPRADVAPAFFDLLWEFEESLNYHQLEADMRAREAVA